MKEEYKRNCTWIESVISVPNLYSLQYFTAVLLIFSVLFCTASEGGTEKHLPEKLLSGYTHYALGQDSIDSTIDHYLDPMKEAGFTACEFKVKPGNLSDTDRRRRLKELCRAAEKRDLALMLYVYEGAPGTSRHPEKHGEYPPLVLADGTVKENRFSPIHQGLWDRWLQRAYRLAKVSKELNIAAVKVDLEHIGQSSTVSYDDHAWKRFAADTGAKKNVPAKRRGAYLQENEMKQKYRSWFSNQLEVVARHFERKMHRINPELVLGLMPTKGNWFYRAFEKHLATENVPAIMDSWSMYQGKGFREAVLREQERLKELNPNNRYVPWFTPVNYRPEDLTVQAYHAGMKTDGYSNWNLVMLNPDATPSKNIYRRPPRYSADDYWQALERANRQILSDLRSEEKANSIPHRPPEPPLRPFDVGDVEVPQLRPSGDGSGEPGWFTLRNRHTFHIYAREGDPITADFTHLAGESRPMPVQYALLNPDGDTLLRGAVQKGEKGTMKHRAPRTGTYALVVTGGDHKAWFDVRIHNAHAGLRVKDKAYIMQRRWMRRTHWVARINPDKPARVNLSTTERGYIGVSLNGGPLHTGQEKTFKLPEERTVHKLCLVAPDDELPEGLSTEKFFVHLKGAVEPYLFDGPERRLSTP